jgi:hypothetical protein
MATFDRAHFNIDPNKIRKSLLPIQNNYKINAANPLVDNKKFTFVGTLLRAGRGDFFETLSSFCARLLW